MRFRSVVSTIVIFAAGATSISAGGGPGTVAIVVNKANSIDDLSSKQLKQIFSGEKVRWTDGQKIQTLATSAASPEHRLAVQFFFGMNESEYQKYCMHATFVGTPQLIPRDSGTSQGVLNFVALIPGAIGFVRADLVTANVKVLKIDGVAPGDEAYPLGGTK
jgi:ABC-type phosphate transport system substrate-binding protein